VPRTRGGPQPAGARRSAALIFFALTVAAFAVSLWLTYRSISASEEPTLAVMEVK
jgi:hypothetical protein